MLGMIKRRNGIVGETEFLVAQIYAAAPPATSQLFALNLKSRFGFYNRKRIRKGVDRSYQHVVLERLHVHIADGAHCGTAIGIKAMQQAFTFNSSVQLLLDGDENLRTDRFHLNRGEVSNCPNSRQIVPCPLNGMADQVTLRGQQLEG